MKPNVQVVKTAFRHGLKFVSKNLPTIMTVCGIAGMGYTAYEVSRSTLEADKAIKEAKAVKEEAGEELTKKEKAIIILKKCWKAFLAGLITIGFFCGANHISLKRQAVLSAAYAMTTNEFKEYKEKVKETLGEKKSEKIEDDIAAEKIASYHFSEANPVGGSGPLWIDAWTNTAYRGNLEDIRKVVNDLNDDLYQSKGKAYFSGEITMNDVLYAIGAACHAPQLGSVSLGEQFGFRADLTGPIDLDIRYGKASNGEPCGYINLKPLPLTENMNDIYY